MPTLPLPPLDEGVPLDCGDLVVNSTDDVGAVWSQDMMGSPVAPVRDAIIGGQTVSLLAWQMASRTASAQNDPLRANDEYLDEIGDEHDVHRQPGEPDDPPTGMGTAYRQRILADPSVVDPNDIIAAANAVLAPYTTISCRYAERADGWFVNDGASSGWSSHLFNEPGFFQVGGPVSSVPNYPDRLYPGVAPVGLQSVPNRRPAGAQLNGDSYGRWFLLRVPDIAQLDTDIACATSHPNDIAGTTYPDDGVSFFLGTGSSVSDDNVTFLFSFSSSSDQVYSAMVAAVEALRMHSVRWTCIVDTNLKA